MCGGNNIGNRFKDLRTKIGYTQGQIAEFLAVDQSFISKCEKNENILVKLYGGRIILTKQVYDELNKPYIPHIRDKTNDLIKNSYISVEEIILGTEEYKLYIEMAYTPQSGYKIMLMIKIKF